MIVRQCVCAASRHETFAGAAIDRFVAAYNPTAIPFEWTKREVHQVDLSHRYADSREQVLAVRLEMR